MKECGSDMRTENESGIAGNSGRTNVGVVCLNMIHVEF